MTQPNRDTASVRAALGNLLDAFFEKYPDDAFRTAAYDFLDKLLVKSLEFFGKSNAGQEQNAEFFTPPQLAKRLGVDSDKVLRWIRSGQLVAVDMVTTQGGRPRYRISLEEVLAFEKRRTVSKPPSPSPRKKPPKQDGIIEFY
jgi:excisionase family DNA binding protein